MMDGDEQRLAANVIKAADALNRAIQYAENAGLDILAEVETSPGTMGALPCACVRVAVLKEIKP